MSSQSTTRLPTEINAGKSSPTVEIIWDDGHRSLYKVSYLRELCPCATCREGSNKESAHQPLVSKASTEGKRRSLPMFKAEKFQITDMHYVGNYALGVNWLDKHQSIFPWSMLSEACPCEACKSSKTVQNDNL